MKRAWLVAVLTVAVVATQMPVNIFPLLSSRIPTQAAAAAPLGRIYVSNQGSGTVSAIDPATNTVIATIPVGTSPYGVAVTPNGARVWVANFGSGNISVIDTSTNTVVQTVGIVGSPHGIAFSAAGDRAYVAVYSTNLVWVFDTTTSPPSSMATIPVGSTPAGVTMRPDGRRLYVANYNNGSGSTVSVIDTEPGSATTNKVVATITVGTGPFQIAVRGDSTRAYVTNLSSDNVSVIDTAANTVVATVAVGDGPAFVAVNSTGGRAYVTNTISNDISVIDTATSTLFGTIAAVGAFPRGIALSPDSTRSYVASSNQNSVNVFAGSGSSIGTVAVGVQPFYVAVVTTGSGSISGVAACSQAGDTLTLTGASVELYSGSVRVATTTADNTTAAFSFPGTAPNATYTVRYRKVFFGELTTSTVSCSVTVTTDASGNATAGPGVFIPNRKNHTWNTAFQIATTPITDYIFRSGQSTWFKIPVRPGQRVSVKITNVPANYSLALYKDIRTLYDQQIAALAGGDPLGAVGNIDASIAPDALSPDELSPDELSPDELSPDALSPDELSPDELSPDELSPDELSPDELSPDALSPDELSPDELSPDELSPDELSPDAYAAAQTAALIGVSAHVGLSPEQIARNTWDNTGFFYMRVRGHNGAFDASLPFTIQATVTDVSCTGVSLTDTPSTVTASGGVQTVILTNSARLSGDEATKSAFLTKLGNFALRDDVKGAVVDLNTIPEAADAYAVWDTPAGRACPAAANVVARRGKDVISAYRALNPTLRYVVIAGNDHVVPFFRNPDQSGLGSEKDYRPAVQDSTASQASLRLGYVLTQDFYGSITPISRFDHELYLPDLAVGRLVESISDMSAVIDAFVSTNGAVAPTRALVTGYDFLADAAGYIADQFAENSMTVDRQLIQPVGEPPSGPNAWTAAQLRSKLFGATTFGILSLNSHFSANTVLASDYATRLLSSEISALPAADTRFHNALILSTGCHSAYSIIDAEATTLTQPLDWTQAFAARGATVIGGTGYQYGDTDFMKYSEKLLADTALELRYGNGPVPIGVALANAKRTYVSSLVSLKGIDEKALTEATLYGLPMLGYDLPASGRLTRPTAGTIGTLTPIVTSPGLSFAELSPTYTLTEHVRPLTIAGTTTTTDAVYWDADGSVAVSPEAPVLPRTLNGVGAAGQAVRGALLQSATYVDQAGITPFTDVATTEVRGAHPRYVTEVFTPVRPFDLNHFAGSNLVTTPFQYRSLNGGTTGVGRRFTTESFRLYYSNLTDSRALAAAPVVYTVALSPNLTDTTKVDVNVTIGGLATVGIAQVWVTYTAESGNLYGRWTSLELTPLGTTTNGAGIASRYSGSIARGSATDASPQSAVRAIIQAVGGNGLVSWASNDGSYYSVVDETATTAHPKATTALNLVLPTTGTYLSTVPVRARLTSGDAGVNGKRLSFRSGGVRVDATTATDAATGQTGWASAQLPLVSAPGVAGVSVGFAEDADHLGSGADAVITVTKAVSSFIATDTTVLVGGSVILATLMGAGEPLGGQLVTLSGAGRTVQTFTDGYGRVRIDTLDGLPAGGFSITISFEGNDRYLAASSVSVAVPSTFVTAGGWILTPTDALNLTSGKKTTFTINAKYKTGETAPSGSLEFQAKESNVTLKGTSFDSMSVNGNTAEVQGRGTLNGAAGWSFRVVMVDGSDSFAITIWQEGVTSYATPSYRAGNTLGGGNVVVH